VAGDYYEVLGVSRDATADQIQQAFRTLARKYHPDVNKDPAAEDRFKEVNEAYHVLSDPETRKRYDRFGEDFRQVPEDWERARGAGAGGFRGAGPSGARVRYGQGFGGAGGGHQHRRPFRRHVPWRWRIRPIPGADQEAVLELTVEEAYRGGKRQLTLDGRNYGVTIPRASSTVSAYGWPERAAEVAAMDRPEICTCGCASSRIPNSGSTKRDVTVDLPVSPWEAVLGTTVAVRLPAAKRKLRCRKGRRPAGGCGCAAKACPTRAVPPATSTQKSR